MLGGWGPQKKCLLQQYHLPGLHKLSSTNLVEIDSSTYRAAQAVVIS